MPLLYILLNISNLTQKAIECLGRYLYYAVVLLSRDVFYVRRDVDLMKTAKVNAYIMRLLKRLSFYLYTQP